MKVLLAIAAVQLPRVNDVSLDRWVLAFTSAVTSLIGLLFGIGPALHHSNLDVHERLRCAGRGALGRRSTERSRRALVVAEVTLAIVLLTGAGLMLRSLSRLHDVDPGFHTGGVSTFSIGQLPRSYSTKEREIAFTNSLVDAIRQIPGVTAADVSFNLPLSGGGPQLPFAVRGAPAPDPRNEPRAQARSAGPQYFAAMGIPLVRGRLFDARDRVGAPQVLIISAEFARRYFPSLNPIGKTIETGWAGPGWPGARFGGQIVGVVGDVRQGALDQAVTPHMYMSYEQWPINEYDVVIRSTSVPSTVLSAARSVLARLDANIPMNDATTFDEVVDASLGDRRFFFMLLAGFAGVSMVLALIGVYGVVSYGVQQRRHEIGIRIALGATPERVVAMILSQGLRLVAAGVLLGTAAGLALTRLLQAMLYGVGPRDPITFVVVPVSLIVVAAWACAIPAGRAARLNPVEAIRAD